jgi:two-component system CheB/CheR fusion protein
MATRAIPHSPERREEPSLRVLLVEDDENDYLLTRELLAKATGHRFDLEWVASYEAAREALRRDSHDVYLFGHLLGRRNGLELLAEAVSRQCRAPVILLTGQDEREVDIEAMKAGAADYLVKGRIDAALLDRSIRYAIERKRYQDSLRQVHAALEQRIRERTTALEQANDRLRSLAEELRGADRRKDEFLAMLAHELRNPLAPIRNALHIIHLRGPERRESIRQAWEIIDRQTEHLSRLVDDLLDVSRITRGKINLQKQPLDVATVVARAVEGSRPLMEARRHTLEVLVPDDVGRVEGDPIRLAQVLWNLLNNAAKYTPEDGRVWLEVEKGQGQIVLRVRDTGVGIPPEALPTVFDLFSQGERTLDRAEGGLGIGLTLVRQLTEMHGGAVEVFSEGPGKGSAFVVRLPLLAENAPAAVSGPGAADVGWGGLTARHRILVVDDNRDSAESLATLLRLVGNDVRTAHDGPRALEAAAAYHPDLVLLDIGLPGLNGYEVARRLRAEPNHHRAVLVAVTGYGGEEDRRRSLAAGFDHHMVKPIDFDALRALLASIG